MWVAAGVTKVHEGLDGALSKKVENRETGVVRIGWIRGVIGGGGEGGLRIIV